MQSIQRIGLLAIIVIAAACFIACGPASTSQFANSTALAAAKENPTPPPPPPSLAVSPGTTVVNTEWEPVPGGTSYKVG